MAYSAKSYGKSKYSNKNSRSNSSSRSDPRITDQYVFFHQSWPSQWHKSPMIINNIKYNCCEQYMMAMKATLFNDQQTLTKIMNVSDPKDHKQLGRQIKNFNQSLWDQNKKQIIYDGNYAKFTQNKKLKKLLLSMDNRTFVEASKSDKIYGIGIGVMDTKADSKRNWRGQNLLGYVITNVRDQILKEQQNQNDTENESKNDNEYDQERVKLVIKILKKIIDEPDNMKYQNLNYKKVYKKLGNDDMMMGLLLNAGFHKDDGNRLLFDKDSFNKLKDVYDDLTTTNVSK